MTESPGFYTRLADREGFNASVRHIQRTLTLLDACGPKRNIADEINSMISKKEFEAEEAQSVANMLLVEKWNYSVLSSNVSSVTESPAELSAEVSKWKALDLVVGYHHPDLGFILINPKNPEGASAIAGFRKNELVVLYAGVPLGNDAAKKSAAEALPALMSLIEGKKVKVSASLLSGPFSFSAPKKPAAQKPVKKAGKTVSPSKGRAPVQAVTAAVMQTGPAASSAAATARPAPAAPAMPGQSKMSPLVSVVVSNELFHNGNVEAWKRIIRSYNARYPGLQVFIYYDGERIVDINTLFKWGKVKHGSCIQFCVAGENIQDLAKLSRYFRQGASPQFEAFLKGSPDTVMNLF